MTVGELKRQLAGASDDVEAVLWDETGRWELAYVVVHDHEVHLAHGEVYEYTEA